MPMSDTLTKPSMSRRDGGEPRPLVRFGGLAILFVPFVLPWQYLTSTSVVELSSGESFTVWEPGATMYPIETDASILLYFGAVMAIALMAFRSFTWLIYLTGGGFILWAWNRRLGNSVELSGWEGSGQMLIESGAVALGLMLLGFAVLAGQLSIGRMKRRSGG